MAGVKKPGKIHLAVICIVCIAVVLAIAFVFFISPNMPKSFSFASFGNFFEMPDFNIANPFEALPSPEEIFKLPENPFSYGNPFEA